MESPIAHIQFVSVLVAAGTYVKVVKGEDGLYPNSAPLTHYGLRQLTDPP